MSTYDYSKPAATAARLIAKFGSAGYLVRTTSDAGYDPEAGEVVDPTELTREPITACAFPYEEKVIDGTRIQQGDKQVFVSAIGLAEPKTDDQFIWPAGASEETYTIIDHKELSPDGATVVLHEWRVRK